MKNTPQANGATHRVMFVWFILFRGLKTPFPAVNYILASALAFPPKREHVIKGNVWIAGII